MPSAPPARVTHRRGQSADARYMLAVSGETEYSQPSCTTGIAGDLIRPSPFQQGANSTPASRQSLPMPTEPRKMSVSNSSLSPSTAGHNLSVLPTPRRIRSEYDLSIHRDDALSSKEDTEQGKKRSGTSRWLRHVKDWMFTSEPSVKAMKEEWTKAQKRQGEGKDSRSMTKFHYPGGQIPEGVITSTSGPRPEKALRHSVRDSALRKSYLPVSPTHHSIASSGSWAPSSPSIREGNPVAPWDK